MDDRLEIILDYCLERIKNGETIEECLVDFPYMKSQLEPLLKAALTVSNQPEVSISEEERQTADDRLISRLPQEASKDRTIKPNKRSSLKDNLTQMQQLLRQAGSGLKKTAIPIALAIIIAIILEIGASSVVSPSPAIASGCTLSILSGGVEIQNENEKSQAGTDGMTLDVGTRVITAPNSHAIITFFDGSTIKLEPDTDIEIQRLISNDKQNITIVLKQWMGKTWSRVIKMADPASLYEIKTPSAHAVVRGTLFTTVVDEDGQTTVATTEGLVSVVGHGKEVYIPAKRQTHVQVGTVPAEPYQSSDTAAVITVAIDAPAIASIIDPAGASTGLLPNGMEYNQILGSQCILLEKGTQVITIPQPKTGEYVIALRYIIEGEANLSIQGESDGKIVFDHHDNYEGTGEQGWLVKLNLQVEDNIIVGGYVTGVEPLTGENPEKIIVRDLSRENDEPIEQYIKADNGQEPDNTAPPVSGDAPDNATPEDNDDDMVDSAQKAADFIWGKGNWRE